MGQGNKSALWVVVVACGLFATVGCQSSNLRSGTVEKSAPPDSRTLAPAQAVGQASSAPQVSKRISTAAVTLPPGSGNYQSAATPGLVTEGVALQADTSSLYDRDGMGTLSFQWQSSSDMAQWMDIINAVSSSYTPVQADVGRHLRLVLSYLDGQGNQETIVSGGSNPVININDSPVGLVRVMGHTEEGQMLVADTRMIRDGDGLGAMSYRWEKTLDRHSWQPVARGERDTLRLSQAEVGHNIRLLVSYTDGQGTKESLLSIPSPVVANMDDPPQGQVLVIGDAAEGLWLSGDATSLTDADGMEEVFFLWQISNDGKLWRDLPGEQDRQVELNQSHVGKQVRVIAQYRDDFGEEYLLASEPTGKVRNMNDAPVGVLRITGMGGYPAAVGQIGAVSPVTSLTPLQKKAPSKPATPVRSKSVSKSELPAKTMEEKKATQIASVPKKVVSEPPLAKQVGTVESGYAPPFSEVLKLTGMPEDGGVKRISANELLSPGQAADQYQIEDVTLVDSVQGILRQSEEDVWSFYPNNDFHGLVALRVDMLDPSNEKIRNRVEFQVYPVNDAPMQVIFSLPVDYYLENGGDLSSEEILGTFFDADGDELMLTSFQIIEPGVGSLQLQKEKQHLIYKHLGALDTRPTLKLTVTDGEITVDGVIELVLQVVNSSPLGKSP